MRATLATDTLFIWLISCAVVINQVSREGAGRTSTVWTVRASGLLERSPDAGILVASFELTTRNFCRPRTSAAGFSRLSPAGVS